MKTVLVTQRSLHKNLLLTLLFASSLSAQVRQIDRAKLPQNQAVQQAYTDLLSIDQYARNYAQSWPYMVSKEHTVLQFTSDLNTLEAAQRTAPNNGELRLLTGLVAHLAYNLDVESAYGPAMTLLQAAEAAAGQDFRPGWFLGMQQCESNDPVNGMQHLLHEEDSHTDLPAFWRDYMLCAQVAFMPAHALRAYDTISRTGLATAEDDALARMVRGRFKSSDIKVTYAAKTAWQADRVGDRVRFVSTLCGEAFSIKPDWQINIADAAHGTCAVTITPGTYPTRQDVSSPTLLLLTKVAKQGQTLESFMQDLMKGPNYSAAKPITGLPCPVDRCVSYEIVNPAMYANAGGAHLLAVGFASDQPAYPGLRLEHPQPLPKLPDSAQPQFLRPDDILRRFDGSLFTFVALDANADIFRSSRADFEIFLKSLEIDSK